MLETVGDVLNNGKIKMKNKNFKKFESNKIAILEKNVQKLENV